MLGQAAGGAVGTALTRPGGVAASPGHRDPHSKLRLRFLIKKNIDHKMPIVKYNFY